MIMNWKKIGRKRPWHILRYYTSIFLGIWNKTIEIYSWKQTCGSSSKEGNNGLWKSGNCYTETFGSTHAWRREVMLSIRNKWDWAAQIGGVYIYFERKHNVKYHAATI
jgi:hypothetical protein